MHGAAPDPRLTPELLLSAYAAGVFPMAESAEDAELLWLDPQHRGILPLEAFHLPRRLARTVRQGRFEVRVDTAFDETMAGCAQRTETWINDTLLTAYAGLHRIGHAHSVEAWRDGRLVGGLYGVRLGAAFFGESMFSHEQDASKVALVHLVARLRKGGFRLLDTQFTTAHLSSFGVIEIPRLVYRVRLDEAIRAEADFGQSFAGPGDVLSWATTGTGPKAS